jgi:hypothetical protein
MLNRYMTKKSFPVRHSGFNPESSVFLDSRFRRNDGFLLRLMSLCIVRNDEFFEKLRTINAGSFDDAFAIDHHS